MLELLESKFETTLELLNMKYYERRESKKSILRMSRLLAKSIISVTFVFV